MKKVKNFMYYDIFIGGSAGRLSDLDLYATAGEFAPLDKNKDGKLSKVG